MQRDGIASLDYRTRMRLLPREGKQEIAIIAISFLAGLWKPEASFLWEQQV